MLVIGRRVDQTVFIDIPPSPDTRLVCVTIIAMNIVENGVVRLGFRADRDIAIIRDDAVNQVAKSDR